MSKICEVCGKGYLRGNLVPRGVGKRVLRRTTTKQMPNLRTKRFELEDGNRISVKLCASCLKKLSH